MKPVFEKIQQLSKPYLDTRHNDVHTAISTSLAFQLLEREGVEPLAGQVVDRPDHSLSLVALPGGVAGVPVADVGGPRFDQVVLVAVGGCV